MSWLVYFTAIIWENIGTKPNLELYLKHRNFRACAVFFVHLLFYVALIPGLRELLVFDGTQASDTRRLQETPEISLSDMRQGLPRKYLGP